MRFVLMKLDSDRRNETSHFTNKFIGKVASIFSALPKPKEWQSFLNNDLPLITSIDEDVQQIAVITRIGIPRQARRRWRLLCSFLLINAVAAHYHSRMIMKKQTERRQT